MIPKKNSKQQKNTKTRMSTGGGASGTRSSKKISLRDVVLWALIVALVAVGIVANFYYAAFALSLRLIGWLVLACVLVALALQTQAGRAGWDFIKLARMEMRKVVWPSRQETTQTTLIVVAMVMVMALLLWGIDTFLLWGIGVIAGQAG